MDVAAFVVAAIALIVAIASFGVSLWHSSTSVDRMRADRRAHVTGRQVSRGTRESDGQYDIWIRNAGRAPAWHVYLALGDQSGPILFEPGDSETFVGALMPHDPEKKTAIHGKAGDAVYVFWKDEEHSGHAAHRLLLTLR